MRQQQQQQRKQQARVSDSHLLLPGLPDEHALECLARVPLLSNLWGVCKKWQLLIQSDAYFRSRRRELGLQESPQWLYALFASSSSSASSSETEWRAYDPLCHEWRAIPPMPMGDVAFQLAIPGFVGHSHSIQSTSTEHQLIVVAGTRASGAAGGRLEAALPAPLIFETRTSTWSQAAPLAVSRRWCASGAACGKLLVASGCGREWDNGVAREAQLCDIGGGGGWSPLPSLPTTKLSAEATAAVALDGRLHMVSGRGVFAKVGVVLDVAAAEWRDMPRGMRSGWSGDAIAACGKIFVVDDIAGRLKFYDDSLDAWQILLVDERLRGLSCLAAQPGGGGTKICARGSGVIRVIDLANDPIRILDVAPPPAAAGAQIVGLQLLSSVLL